MFRIKNKNSERYISSCSINNNKLENYVNWDTVEKAFLWDSMDAAQNATAGSGQYWLSIIEYEFVHPFNL